MHNDKKVARDALVADEESKSINLEKKIRQIKDSIQTEESRFHYLNAMLELIKAEQVRLKNEIKCYFSTDLADKKRSFRYDSVMMMMLYYYFYYNKFIYLYSFF